MTRRALNAAGELNEAGFQAQVIGLARVYGWRIYHAPDNRPAGRSGKPQRLAAPEGRGFPDLVLVKGPRLIFAELKTRTGRLQPGQEEWLEALREVDKAIIQSCEYQGPDQPPSVEAYLWRPADWGLIQATLGVGERRRTDLDPPRSL
jgi:hypothetical protein